MPAYAMPLLCSGPSILIPNPEHSPLPCIDPTRESDPGVAAMDRAMRHDSEPEQRAVASVVSLL